MFKTDTYLGWFYLAGRLGVLVYYHPQPLQIILELL
jgi:hypothetical protein